MNENDKKFITNTFEDVLDKKFDTLQKAIIDQQKTYQQYVEERTDEDKESLLKELQTQTNKGNSTLAKQIEQLKLEREHRTKQALKSVKDGGKSLLHGSDQILTQIASIHPMLSVLYGGTKTLGKGTWNIGKGLFGVGKGLYRLGKGAVSGVNALVQNFSKMFNKKQTSDEQTEDVKETKTSLGGIQPIAEEEPTAMKMIEQKTSLPKAMAGLQDVLLNQQKDNKKTSNMLASGLNGLGKTMSVIGDTLSLVAHKSKMIATLVGAAVLAILAIRGWIVNGGFDKFANNLMNKFKASFSTEEGVKARKEADAYVQGELKKIDTDATSLDSTLKTLDMGTQQNVFNVSIPKDKQLTPVQQTEYTNNQIKNNLSNLGISGTHAETLMRKSKEGGYGLQGGGRKLGLNKTFDLSFPFKTKVYEIIDVDDKYCDFRLGRGSGANQKIIVFTQAIKSSVKFGDKKENEKIATLDVGSVVFGDVDGFLDIREGETIKDALLRQKAPEIAAEANKKQEQHYKTAGLDIDDKMRNSMAGTYKTYTKDNLTEAPFDDTFGGAKTENPEASTHPVPKSDVNDKNQSSSKVEEQDKKEQDLAKQPKQKPQQVAGAPQPGASKDNKIAFTGSGAQGTTQYGDQMNLHQFDAAAPNRYATTVT